MNKLINDYLRENKFNTFLLKVLVVVGLMLVSVANTEASQNKPVTDNVLYSVYTEAGAGEYSNTKLLFPNFQGVEENVIYECVIYPDVFPGWHTTEYNYGADEVDGQDVNYCMMQGYLQAGVYFVAKVVAYDVDIFGAKVGIAAETSPFVVRATTESYEVYPARVVYSNNNNN